MHFCSWKVLESIFYINLIDLVQSFSDFSGFQVWFSHWCLVLSLWLVDTRITPILLRAKWSQYLFEIPSEGSSQLNRMIEKHILSDLYWLHNANSKRRRLLLTLNSANWGDLARPFCFWQVSLDKNPLRPTVLNWLYIFSLKNESDLINWIQVTGVRLYFLSVNFRFENTPLVCFG